MQGGDTAHHQSMPFVGSLFHIISSLGHGGGKILETAHYVE